MVVGVVVVWVRECSDNGSRLVILPLYVLFKQQQQEVVVASVKQQHHSNITHQAAAAPAAARGRNHHLRNAAQFAVDQKLDTLSPPSKF